MLRVPRIAALYVDLQGTYSRIPNVELWDPSWDARAYPGPHPIVAHPPCQRWGKLAGMHNAQRARKAKLAGRVHISTFGEDGGCFRSAVEAVRAYGGVLEHPEGSGGWALMGIRPPRAKAGWIDAGDGVGWTISVEQGQYGHVARKTTWLYAVGVNLIPLDGRAGKPMEPYPWEDADDPIYLQRRKTGKVCGMPSTHAREATPVEFRDVLVCMARSAAGNGEIRVPRVLTDPFAALVQQVQACPCGGHGWVLWRDLAVECLEELRRDWTVFGADGATRIHVQESNLEDPYGFVSLVGGPVSVLLPRGPRGPGSARGIVLGAGPRLTHVSWDVFRDARTFTRDAERWLASNVVDLRTPSHGVGGNATGE